MPPSDTINPIVSFKVFGSTKCSSAKKEVGPMSLVKWTDHFFFEKANCSVDDIENETIVIELRDQRLLLSDSLIGRYSMDLTHVYFQKDHALVHKWLALANPECEDFSSIKGYLKLGISILGEGDDQVDLAVPEVGELKDEDMLLPPQIQPKACQIIVRVIKGEHFPKMDAGGTVDAYIDCEFAGCHIRTKIITRKKEEAAVEWYEDLYVVSTQLPAVIPTVTGKLKIRVWDYDNVTPDELIGTITIEFEDLEREMRSETEKRYGNYLWANVYGAPMEGTSGSFKDKMNADPRLASFWRGRVLLRVHLEETQQPKLTAVPVKDLEHTELRRRVANEFDGTSTYETRCQIFGGSSLPLEGKQLRVMLRWGATEIVSSVKPNIKGACDWYETLPRKEIYSPSENIEDLPDVFLYLMDEHVIVSYIRLHPTEFHDLYCTPHWYQLVPDKSTARVSNDWEGGFLLIRFYTGHFDSSRDTPAAAGWREKPVRPPLGNKLLVVNLFQCRNLPPADSNGKADPFVVVTCGAQKRQTDEKARMNNLNPVSSMQMWYETLILPVTCQGKDDAPPILIQVWDYDLIGSNDLMGMYVARVKSTQATEAAEDPNTYQPPTWRKLTMGMSSGLGEILISFNFIPATVKPSFNLT